ncbi:hypothetical protein F4820DRAFT_440610 [Hypoxylon rubiginosum]|uniref:Uncharacterized protein n=1 Tax=Hypoxylon rubiginosum TaxID=110542 RepID=A0ACB9YJ65_9PEZI|nr:hypothetical protein F4820DRAFT_440610 [Hypoxylon rubiginosum]
MPEPVTTPPIKPVPFHYDEDDRRNTPNLDDEEFDHLTAVLKALARGSYPRLDSVPLALNAYNCNRRGNSAYEEEDPWAYFHPITTITPEEVPLRRRPVVQLDDKILKDLKKPWVSIRVGDKFGGSREAEASRPGRGNNRGKQQQQQNSAQYRFICFIHKHRIDRRGTPQKGVHTISIWDREVSRDISFFTH